MFYATLDSDGLNIAQNANIHKFPTEAAAHARLIAGIDRLLSSDDSTLDAPMLPLRAWRRRMGWTQSEAARHLGISYRWYQELDAGRRKVSPRITAMIERLSD